MVSRYALEEEDVEKLERLFTISNSNIRHIDMAIALEPSAIIEDEVTGVM